MNYKQSIQVCLCLITLAEEDSGRPQERDEDREILGAVGSEVVKKRLNKVLTVL